MYPAVVGCDVLCVISPVIRLCRIKSYLCRICILTDILFTCSINYWKKNVETSNYNCAFITCQFLWSSITRFIISFDSYVIMMNWPFYPYEDSSLIPGILLVLLLAPITRSTFLRLVFAWFIFFTLFLLTYLCLFFFFNIYLLNEYFMGHLGLAFFFIVSEQFLSFNWSM